MFNGNVICHAGIEPMIKYMARTMCSSPWYMENFFNNGSITLLFHILNVHEGLGEHAKDGRCA